MVPLSPTSHNTFAANHLKLLSPTEMNSAEFVEEADDRGEPINWRGVVTRMIAWASRRADGASS